MGTNDLLVVVGGVAVGFLVVWMFWGAGKSASTPPVAEPREPWPVVLGLEPNASVDEIREAYRTLRQDYDPARVAGLGPELRALAERKSASLAAARDAALAERGAA